MVLRSLLALCASCLALPAGAILIRPDRDDSEYLELATRYSSSVLLNAPDGEGVLIAPRYVLTAAHMARALQEMKALPRLEFAGRQYAIQSIHIHSEYRKGVPAADVALLYLRDTVAGVAPTPIYRDKDEGGKAVVIVGHGYSGRIGDKPVKEKWDRRKRAAINTIDRVSPRTLALQIKAADEASDLQGAAAPGDSGGPAFIETPQGLFVAGIGSATDDTNADGIIGNVGDWEIYARVSAFASWVEAVMTDIAVKEADALMGEDKR